ncbi:peptidylprolyl isomerase [Aestuariimicrobium ganziense]|uniref:peptidylprolyl isomerase n=1 Tax=Aestuariimicrobium ganziense TaxID=2773677 RepID=UPI001943CCD3|nr:peptidylprolyl isomerase [Aestuariimicrobium ganziense]
MGWTRRAWALAMIVVLSAVTGCAEDGGTTEAPTNQARSCEYPTSRTPARPVDPPPSEPARTGTATATLEMAAGTVTITMDRAKTPCTVNSFESLVQQQFYDDTRCHRLVDTGIFILQCGDPSAVGTGGPGYTFDDELTGSETYPAGTVAMANAGPNTNGSQFFIVWADTQLDPKYTVFGTVDPASLEVIQQIASQGVDGVDGVSPIADASIKTVVMG